jgi:hypothetical protein
MKQFNLLMMVTTWVCGHILIYQAQHYLTETYVSNIPFILGLFLLAMYSHHRLFTHMTFKVLSYL